MMIRKTIPVAFCFATAAVLCAGCRSAGPSGGSSLSLTGSSWGSGRSRPPAVRNVVCLFDQRPWISADAGSDLDPEGIQFRVFLDTGQGKARFVEGTFHVEMYKIERSEAGKTERILVSDWHYPTSTFVPLQAKVMGEGYHLQLHWARKELAGSEIDLVTKFEDEYGNICPSDTKRLRIPKYSY